MNDNWNGTPNIGNRVVVLDGGGAIVGRLGAAHEGEAPDQFLMPHHVRHRRGRPCARPLDHLDHT